MNGRPDSFMPLYIGDYLRDTAHLDATGHGVYLLLLMHCWQRGELPKRDTEIRRIGRVGAKQWRALKEPILGFFRETDTGYRQKRVDEELARAVETYTKRAAGAFKTNEKLGRSTNKLDAERVAERDARRVAQRVAQRLTSKPDPETQSVSLCETSTDTQPHPQPYTSSLPSYSDPRANVGPVGGHVAHVVAESRRPRSKPTPLHERVVKPSDVIVTTADTRVEGAEGSALSTSLAKLREARVLAALRAFHGKDEAARIWAGYTSETPDPDCIASVEWISKRDGIAAP